MIIFPEDKNSNFYSQKSMGSFLTAFVPFLFKQPIRLKNDSAYDLSDSIGLSFSDCKERFFYSTIPLAPAIKMCLINNRSYVAWLFFYIVSEINVVLSQEGVFPVTLLAEKYNCHPQNFAFTRTEIKRAIFFINLLKNRTTKELCFYVKIMKKGLFN